MYGEDQDQPQQVAIDLGAMRERIDKWVDGAVRMAPRIVVAITVAVRSRVVFASNQALDAAGIDMVCET